MSESKPNGEPRVEDFLLPEFEDVTLPSGMKCTLRPPNDLEFYARCGTLPGKLAALARGEKVVALDPEEIVDWAWKLISSIFITPRFSLNPKEGEFHPNRLRSEDRKFLDRWAAKYFDLGGGGDGLETFRERESGPTASPGASGGEVSSPAQPIASTQGQRLGD